MAFLNAISPMRMLEFEKASLLGQLVMGVLFLQLALLGILLSYTMVRVGLRTLRNKRGEKLIPQYQQEILAYLFNIQEGEKPAVQPKINKKWQRVLYRQQLLSFIGNLKGAEKESLIKLYRHLGFFKEDIRQLRSSKWWKRLSALIRLERVKTSQIAHSIAPLLHDKNSLVVLEALRLMSYLDYPKKTSLILQSIDESILLRGDVLREVLINVGREDPSAISKLVFDSANVHLCAICLNVLGSLRWIQTVPTLVKYLRTPNLHSDLISEALAALGKIGDLRVTRTVSSFLGHPSPAVRAMAIQTLGLLGEKLPKTEINKLSADTSIEVKRALRAHAKITCRFGIASWGYL